MDAYVRNIFETAFKTAECNLVALTCVSEKDIAVVPGELIGVDCNVGKQFATDTMAEAMLSGKFATTEMVETVVTDDVTMERNPDGEYRCYKRTNENIYVDTETRLGVLYCKHSLVKPSLIPAVDRARAVFSSQRAVFRFGSAKLIVEFQEGACVHKVHGEIRPGKTTHQEAKHLLRVMMGKGRAANF